MADQFIQLQLGQRVIRFERFFVGASPPRRKDEMFEVGLNAYGAFTLKGRVYEDKEVFDFTTLISYDSKTKIDALYTEHHRLRRNRNPNPEILLTDCTSKFVEAVPRTRAIAPAPFNSEELINGGLDVQYFAKFYVFFMQRPEYEYLENCIKATLRFKESDRKVPLGYDG